MTKKMDEEKLFICNSQAPLREVSGKGGKKLATVSKGGIATFIRIVPDVPYNKLNTIWLELEYHGIRGFSYAGFWDKYENILPQDVVDISDLETKNPYDARQNIVLDGKKSNRCGELCCSYILDMKLSDVLSGWERKEPNIVARIFKGSNDKGTGPTTLIGLLESFGIDGCILFNTYFKDPLLKRNVFTPQRAFDALQKGFLILGVKIGRQEGYLGRSGNINHWVVLTDIEIYGAQAVCTVYNPYMNRYESYSWEEIIKAGANIDGVFVPRDRKPMNWLESIEVPPPYVEPHPKPIEKVVGFGDGLSLEEKVAELWKEYEFILNLRNSP